MELSNPRKSEPSGREPRPDMAAASLTPGKIRSKWDGTTSKGSSGDAEGESGGDDDGRVRYGSNGAERDKWKASGDPKTRSGLGTVKSVGFRRIRMFVTYWGRRGGSSSGVLLLGQLESILRTAVRISYLPRLFMPLQILKYNYYSSI